MLTNDLAFWPQVRRLESKFLAQVEKFFIFENGRQALFWTFKDQVFHTYEIRFPDKTRSTDPVEISELSGQKVTYADQGSEFVVLLTSTGNLFLWTPKRLSIQPRRPTIVATRIRLIRSGETHVAMVDQDGTFLTMGLNTYGQLGHFAEFVAKPKPVMDLQGCDIIDFACDDYTTYVLTARGSIYHWGTFEGGLVYVQPEFMKLPKWLSRMIKSIEVVDSQLLILTTKGHLFRIEYRREIEDFILSEVRSPNFIPLFFTEIISLKSLMGVALRDKFNALYYYNSFLNYMKKIEINSPVDLASLVGTLSISPRLTWINKEAKIANEVNDFNNPLSKMIEINIFKRTIYGQLEFLTPSTHLNQANPSEHSILTIPHYPSIYLYLRHLHTGRIENLVDFGWDLFLYASVLQDERFLNNLTQLITARLVSMRVNPRELKEFLKAADYRHNPVLLRRISRCLVKPTRPDRSLATRVVRFLAFYNVL